MADGAAIIAFKERSRAEKIKLQSFLVNNNISFYQNQSGQFDAVVHLRNPSPLQKNQQNLLSSTKSILSESDNKKSLTKNTSLNQLNSSSLLKDITRQAQQQKESDYEKKLTQFPKNSYQMKKMKLEKEKEEIQKQKQQKILELQEQQRKEMQNELDIKMKQEQAQKMSSRTYSSNFNQKWKLNRQRDQKKNQKQLFEDITEKNINILLQSSDLLQSASKFNKSPKMYKGKENISLASDKLSSKSINLLSKQESQLQGQPLQQEQKKIINLQSMQNSQKLIRSQSSILLENQNGNQLKQIQEDKQPEKRNTNQLTNITNNSTSKQKILVTNNSQSSLIIDQLYLPPTKLSNVDRQRSQAKDNSPLNKGSNSFSLALVHQKQQQEQESKKKKLSKQMSSSSLNSITDRMYFISANKIPPLNLNDPSLKQDHSYSPASQLVNQLNQQKEQEEIYSQKSEQFTPTLNPVPTKSFNKAREQPSPNQKFEQDYFSFNNSPKLYNPNKMIESPYLNIQQNDPWLQIIQDDHLYDFSNNNQERDSPKQDEFMQQEVHLKQLSSNELVSYYKLIMEKARLQSINALKTKQTPQIPYKGTQPTKM